MRPQDIIGEIEALSSHYMRPVRSPEEHSRWLADYVEDLKLFPDEAVSASCRSWRSNPDNAKFPTPGQLAALARAHQRHKVAGPEAILPWAPLTAEQIGALSLRDKIRYHKIAASEAGKKAGPMWSNGRPATEDQLPPDRAEKRRFWLAQSDAHWREVERLTRVLVQRDRRA